MSNINTVCSHTAGIIHMKPLNPKIQLISLNTLVKNGSHHGTHIVAIILYISSASDNTSLQVQQRYNGIHSQVNNVRHDINMVVMCPFSPPGYNTAMILFGSGCCEIFFEADISLRDYVAIRK